MSINPYNLPKWAAVLFTRNNGSSWVGLFAWNPDKETVSELRERICKAGTAQVWFYDKPNRAPGSSYEDLARFVSQTLMDIPENFDLPALIRSDNVIVFDHNNKQIHSMASPSKGKVSDQGRWLSRADQYSKGPNGETQGPSGLSFL